MNRNLVFVAPFALLSLLLGINAGLIRMGLDIPIIEIMPHHGPLMVGSFLGTVILIERVATLKIRFLYVFPFLSGISGLLILIQFPSPALICQSIASLGLISIYGIIIYRYKSSYYYLMFTGAVFWLLGLIQIIFDFGYSAGTYSWFLFVLYTILAERLELSKFMPSRPMKIPTLYSILILSLLGVLLKVDWILGIAFLLIGLWLFSYDIIRISIRKEGIHRFVATSLGLGYGWLGITGLLLVLDLPYGFVYDAIVHGFFIGFTFNMIFAHGPIIFPGVAGLTVKPYHPVLYLWTILLNLSLLIRIWADLISQSNVRLWAGIANSAVILLYFVTLIVLIRVNTKTSTNARSS